MKERVGRVLTCHACKAEKHELEFYVRAAMESGRDYKCIECRRAEYAERTCQNETSRWLPKDDRRGRPYRSGWQERWREMTGIQPPDVDWNGLIAALYQRRQRKKQVE